MSKQLTKKDIKYKLFKKLDKLIAFYETKRQEFLMFGAQLRRLEERVIKLESKNR